MSRLRKTVVPFKWQTVTLSFTNGTAASVNLATFVSNSQGKALTYSVYSGALPGGCTLAGSTVSYNGTGGVASSAVAFQVTDGTYSAQSSSVTCSIIAAPTQPNRAPVWSVADNYALPGITAGTSDTVGVSVYASDPDNNPLTFSRTGGTAPADVTVSSSGVLTRPADVPAGSYSVTVTADDGQSNADADWLLRSTGTGVVWAHDFRTAAEVTNFIDSDPATTTTTYSTDGFTGGSVQHSIPGNVPQGVLSMTTISATQVRVVVASDMSLTANTDYVRFFGLTAPWDIANDSYDGGSGVIEKYKVTTLVNSTTFDIDPTQNSFGGFNPVGFSAYSGSGTATAQRCRVSQGSWNRPMSALLSGGNGLAVNDAGVAGGHPGRTWSTTWSGDGNGNSIRHSRWRYDYFSHSDYSTAYDGSPGIAAWWDWDGSTQLSNNWRGSDFWVQWRVKISASRYQASTASVRNSGSLKYVAAWTTWRTPIHEVVWSDRNVTNSPYANYPATVGGSVDGYTGAGTSKQFSEGSHMQPGGDYDATCLWTGNFPASAGACFNITPDEWTCFLMHVIPGKQVAGWTGWPTTATNGTGIQLWACPQSRITAGNPTYLKIFDKTGANAYPFQYDNWGTGYTNFPAKSEPPPGWNSILLWTYQNNLPQPYGWTRNFTQVILKKGNGGSNPQTDGIPCPTV